MRFVDHYDGIKTIREITDLVELGNSAVHTKGTIGNDDPAARTLSRLQLLFKVRHIVMLVPVTLSFAKPDTIDNGRMIQLIGDDGILFAKQRFKNTSVGIKSRSIKDGVFSAKESGYLFLKLFVNVLRAADETATAHPISPRVDG